MNKPAWNSALGELRSMFKSKENIDAAKQLALKLHAMVFTSEMSGTVHTTFEDELWDGLDEETLRFAVNKKGRTIVYGLWHSARIEDITMNLLVAGRDQLFEKDKWEEKIKSPVRHTGNSLSSTEIMNFSSLIDITELKAYRTEVGRNSENIIRNLKQEDLHRKIYKDNLKRILDEGAVDNVESANWLIDFWRKKDVAGIILMPCLRHQLVHINESMEAKSNNRKTVRS
ncbi:hypothetical protein [Pararcticibacter amylolyticus]|uniref:DinB-like domain-containing protein n=1 Tax=Pararcticibacter amylolyticus TaxID=2173175 RepID=A0A2U2PIT2_9SPHI|nr:hypothetical protein [Pararcticibacter amylolyticus]PWG81305.1 hypothetical protein DDR33_08005 [Pararcticibacter amylolyticus]